MARTRMLWLGSFVFAALSMISAAGEESIEVTVTGTLQTGVVAIGAETTGTTIKAKDITWELDLGKDEALKAAAEKLSGQPATVTGTLTRRAGVEVKERWIVTVKTLRAATDKPKRAENEPAVEAQGVREGTKAAIVATAEQTTVEIRCERGIDGCELKRLQETWPANLVLHLRLRGLESLQVTQGNATLEWSVRSSAPHESTCTYKSGKRVSKQSPPDPLYTAVQLITAKENTPAGIPLDGYFAVTIPGKFLESNPERLRIQWIDFYR